MRHVMLLCVILVSAPALPASADEDDLAQVQGRWQRLAKDREGRTVQFEKEHKGHKTTYTSFDQAGVVAYSHTSEFELSRTGQVRIFTYFNLVVAGTNPGRTGGDRRSYIHKIEGDRFFEVQGMLIGQEKEQPTLIIWERLKK
jgi:hypothetical protein